MAPFSNKRIHSGTPIPSPVVSPEQTDDEDEDMTSSSTPPESPAPKRLRRSAGDYLRRTIPHWVASAMAYLKARRICFERRETPDESSDEEEELESLVDWVQRVTGLVEEEATQNIELQVRSRNNASAHFDGLAIG